MAENAATEPETVTLQPLPRRSVQILRAAMRGEFPEALQGKFPPPRQWADDEIAILCGHAPEPFADPTVQTGIGGSEEAVIYLSRELSALGRKVTVYNRCDEYAGTYNGVTYRPSREFNPTDSFNVVVGWRWPRLFLRNLTAKKKVAWLHNEPVPGEITPEVVEAVDVFAILSKFHRTTIPQVPEEKIFYTNNGLVPEQFQDLPPRRRHSVGYFSSYDRGLECLIRDIMPKVREKVPDATLDIAYGWHAFLAILGKVSYRTPWQEEVNRLMDQPWITHHGRLNHTDVARLMGSTQVWAYPTEFEEVNCITLQKVQAAGCKVLCTDVAALPERVIAGYVVREGRDIYTNAARQAEFVEALIRLFDENDEHAAMPSRCVAELALERFAWSTTAKDWDARLKA